MDTTSTWLERYQPSNVVPFTPRPVSYLWAPRKGTNAAWRVTSRPHVLEFRPSSPAVDWYVVGFYDNGVSGVAITQAASAHDAADQYRDTGNWVEGPFGTREDAEEYADHARIDPFTGTGD